MEEAVWVIGRHTSQRRAQELLTQSEVYGALSVDYDLVTSYITNIAFRERVEQTLSEASMQGKTLVGVRSLDDSEVNIHPAEYVQQIVAFTAPWIELDSDDTLMAHVSKQVLRHEVAYASFCGVNNIVIAGPRRRANIAQYAHAVASVMMTSPYIQFHIDLPLSEDHSTNADTGNHSHTYDSYAMWDLWNTVRSVCKYNPRLSLSLKLPPKLRIMDIQIRWFTEPIRILNIQASIYVPNGKGFPVLSKFYQNLINQYMKQRPAPFILLGDTPPLPTTPNARKGPHDSLNWLLYLRHMSKNQQPLAAVEKFGAGYQDFLQAPLQPLTDNLESTTYEVFERDPVKYEQYEKAIRLALEDRDPGSTTIVAVVGAGRGPLVSRALQAAETAGRNIQLFAVEKNPNAYVTLLRHNKETWGGRVTVIKSDMRSWKPPLKVDILISELLGSFGDNELSPECLDGVQGVLNPDGGISIPTSYSAHFSPLMAPKIHADITGRLSADPNGPETPYVVYLHQVELLAGNKYIHKAWEFTHPLPFDPSARIAEMQASGLSEGFNDHNTRFSRCTFRIPRRGVVHGLAGYLESVLYGNVEISTRPDTIDAKSKDMISWFPIFFPLKNPIYVPDLSELDVSMWRLTDDKKVWYEWIVEAYTLLEDERFRLGVSELHSSKKVACLM